MLPSIAACNVPAGAALESVCSSLDLHVPPRTKDMACMWSAEVVPFPTVMEVGKCWSPVDRQLDDGTEKASSSQDP